MKKILTFGRYLKKRYPQKIAKIPLSISGFTCPNIDGTKGYGGCIFCQNESFSPNLKTKESPFKLNSFSTQNPILAAQLQEVDAQFDAYAAKMSELGYAKYIAYFQSYTNTYAPLETLKALYDKAVTQKGVIGLSVGTRADSVDQARLELLASYKSKIPEVWIEFGIQSIFDSTLSLINRQESAQEMEEKIALAKQFGLKVCAHLIYGLPNETGEMMLESLKKVLSWGVDSIKIHPLYVVEKTALANELKKGNFTPISKELYLELLVKSFALIPSSVVVQRVSAGNDDPSLLAPSWCKKKNEVMGSIRRTLRDNGYIY